MEKSPMLNVSFVLILVYCTGHLSEARKPLALVPSPSAALGYHRGPLLTGPGSIGVYILWYGKFNKHQRSTISEFVVSFGARRAAKPSVSTWWSTTGGYRDYSNANVKQSARVAGQTSDALYSLGRSLKRIDMAILIRGALKRRLLPIDFGGIYLVLTAADVSVERFCMNSCAFHGSIPVYGTGRVVYAWVGNSGTQCPGQCAWPFAVPPYGPFAPPLVSPNGDIGIDGMVINIAAVLAGAATNPFGNGYYQGSPLDPLEAVTACAGIYGPGAYPGYPGELLFDGRTNASYNAYGVRNRMFLLPAMWDPVTVSCKTAPPRERRIGGIGEEEELLGKFNCFRNGFAETEDAHQLFDKMPK